MKWLLSVVYDITNKLGKGKTMNKFKTHNIYLQEQSSAWPQVQMTRKEAEPSQEQMTPITKLFH